jgi:hypothetical protein
MIALTVSHEFDDSESFGYPDIDSAYAKTLVSDDKVTVNYHAEPNEDGSMIRIQRVVWTKHRNARNRNIVWLETVMVLPRDTTPEFIRDLVVCLAVQ